MDKIEGLRYKRTLFISLGGAGAQTLRRLKKKIIATNGKKPDQIEFLLIDTNATELANYRDFDSSEKVCISVREPYLRYEHDKKNNLVTHEFIPQNNVHSLLALERGAGQIRSNGHFAVIENQYSDRLIRVFREKADKVKSVDVAGDKLEKDPKIEIRLVFSLAGGTGSGTFLPISVLLRAAVTNSELTAYMYSATLFEKFVENSAKYSVMQNAYAALCELDYMMHIGMEGYKTVQFNFGPHENQHIVASNRPFDEVYYIDKRTNLPTSYSVEFVYNEKKRLQDNTSEIMHIAATNIITAHQGTVDNVRQKIQEGQFNIGDKYAWVSGVGIAKLQLNKDSSGNLVVMDAALRAIKARLDLEEIDSKEVQAVANKFNDIGIRFDESKGNADGDPILTRFVREDVIRTYCGRLLDKMHDAKKCHPKYRSYDFKKHLDDVIDGTKKAGDMKKELCKTFENQLDELIECLLKPGHNRDLLGEYLGEKPDCQGEKRASKDLSLKFVFEVLDQIKKMLSDSEEQLKDEINDWEKNEQDENIEIENKCDQANAPVPPNANAGGGGVNTLASIVRPHQENALKYMLLKERAEAAKGVFTDAISFLKEKEDFLHNVKGILTDARSYGIEVVPKDDNSTGGKDGKNEKSDQNRKLKEREQDRVSKAKPLTNIVEVPALDLKGGFSLEYKHLKELYNSSLYVHSKLPNNQAKFTKICEFIQKKERSLNEYLTDGLKEIDELGKDQHIKVERTECQKKIDKLIELSTSTMQVDYHGYGGQVKIDPFWYIMTDCPEENEGEKELNPKKSVGALLKELIEQNTLDAKINLVHVPGWDDRAVVYRVDSAIPAYFVEGVCVGQGGYTLEGCYEELKKTQRTYTPFSHKLFQEELENKLHVLKPHEDANEGEALEHWVNFNLLGLIQFESTKGTTGTYKIDSERLGEVRTNELTDLRKVLILGETRASAFNTFMRYCKTLVEENPNVPRLNGFTYSEAINPLEHDSLEAYEKMFVMSGEDYLDEIFGEDTLLWRGETISWKDYCTHLDQNDVEYKLLKNEIKYMEERKKRYE